MSSVLVSDGGVGVERESRSDVSSFSSGIVGWPEGARYKSSMSLWSLIRSFRELISVIAAVARVDLVTGIEMLRIGVPDGSFSSWKPGLWGFLCMSFSSFLESSSDPLEGKNIGEPGPLLSGLVGREESKAVSLNTRSKIDDARCELEYGEPGAEEAAMEVSVWFDWIDH
jgi:hypothetical protein